MKTHRFLLAIIIGLILLTGCQKPEEKTEVIDKPTAVKTQKVTSRDLPVVVKSVGRLVPDREVVISTEVSGIIQAYKVDVGDPVRSDRILVQLDPMDYQLALQEAKANLSSAKAQLAAAEKSYERSKVLMPEKLIAVKSYDLSEAGFKSSMATVTQLEAVVSITERRLQKTTIKAPFGGYVTQRFVELGQSVGVGAPLMSIADIATMRVKVHLNERDYVHLDMEDPVGVLVDALPDSKFTGRVDRIGIKADPRTNTFEVEVLVANPDLVLKAGFTARVAITTKTIPHAILINQSCVLYRENRREVFVIDEEKRAAVREVELGRSEGSEVVIVTGLTPGETLVVAGAQYLSPGDEVSVAGSSPN
jgi:RND family efflux transporter MFP subunit